MADSEFDGLTEAAKGNHIRLEEDAAKKCAEQCGKMLEKLDEMIEHADKELDKFGGENCGGFGKSKVVENAGDLAERYKSRVNGGDSSLKHVLGKHRDVVSDMMDTFIAAGRAYLKHENANSEDLKSILSNYDDKVADYRPKS